MEGAWIAKVTSLSLMPGVTPLPFQWSYVLVPDASGRRAGIHGSVDVAFPPAIPFDSLTPVIGEIVQTGPDTASFNSYWYAIKKGAAGDEIVLIGRSWGQAKSLEPGKGELTHNFEIYMPSADVNGDGLPECNPILVFTSTSVDTRIPSPLR